MNPENNILNHLLEKLRGFLRTETVVGEPVEIGRITFVPISTVSFFLGGGEGNPGNGEGFPTFNYGAGVGCRILPSAMLIIKEGEVTVVSLTEKSSLDKIMEMAPGFFQNTGVRSQGLE